MASNAYHRLDKSQNFMGNKAFAQTIINDLKQKKRQVEYEKKLGVNEESVTDQQTSSQLQKQASREMFRKQQSEIYASNKSSHTGILTMKSTTNHAS